MSVMLNKSKKIGLAVCYKVENYGSALQALATQEMVKSLGFDCECVDYIKTKSLATVISYLHTIFIPYVIGMKISNLKKKLLEKIEQKKFGADFEKRSEKFRIFIQKYFITSKLIVGYQNLRKCAYDYKALVVGSDQIWHPLNLGSHFYTLEWGREKQPRIAYAPSFGVSKIPAIQVNRTKKYLNAFTSISCREQKGVDIVKSLTNRDAKLVLDPTLLFTAEEWNCLLDSPQRLVKVKYIFCYFLGNNPYQRDFVKKLKSLTELPIVFLPHIDEIISTDRDFGDIRLYDIGPAEFFSLIRDAEYVCTDSFHGSVFSILNQKKFVTFNRFNKSKASTNSRIDSLFSLLNLNSHRAKDDFYVNSLINDQTDFKNVLSLLAAYREKSTNYLKDALQESLK